MDMQQTVFVVDDDPSIRKTLPEVVSTAGFNVKTFSCAEDFLNTYKPTMPGCLVLDLRMTGMSGLDLQIELDERHWSIPIIFLSAFGTVDVAAQAMKAGATYFLEKPVEPEILLDQIRQALDDDKTQRQHDSEYQDINERLKLLTPREKQILDMVIQGKASKEIAAELFRSQKTVELHRSHILKKLDARSVAELVSKVVSAKNQ